MSTYHTVGDLLQRCVEASGERTFVVDGDGEMSYAAFDERCARVACGLYERGVRPGSRVALMLPGGIEWLETFFAVARLGAVLVPIEPSFKANEVDCILGDCEASVLVADCTHVPMLDEIVAERLTLRHVFCVSDPVAEFNSYDELAQASSCLPKVEVSADDTLSLTYTSGTTAKPRGVCLSHANYDYTSEAFAAAVGLRGDDHVLCTLPPCHVSSQILGPMAVVQRGATLQVSEAQPLRMLAKTIVASRATVLAAPVAPIERLAAAGGLEPGPLGRLRMAMTTGAKVTPEDHRRFEARFEIPLVTSYGLTEACGVSTVNGPKQHRREVGSCGKPLDGQKLRVVDSQRGERRSFAVGEVALSGPNVMQRYADDERATERVLRDGWLRTGDLGYVDQEGFLYLIGRQKDLIVRGGKHIYAGEIEELLHRHPAVAEAAVIGVFDETKGEEVAAFIVVRDGHHFSEDHVVNYCRQHLATFKCPGVVEQREALPKTPTGHVRKAFLAQYYPARRSR